MKIECDVLVVGAGPAGLSASLLLSKKGISTIVLEKNKFLGNKQISFDITEGSRISKILDEIGIKPLKKTCISEWISTNKSYIFDSNIEDYYFKRGAEKDSIENIIMKKLPKKNTDVLIESKIESIKLKKKLVTEVNIKTTHGIITLNPTYIIGADGADSNLRKRLQIDTEIYATFNGFGTVIETKKIDDIPHTKIYFSQELAPGGYIYSGSVDNQSFFCVVIDDTFSKEIKLQENLKLFLKQKINKNNMIKNYFGGTGVSGIYKNHIKNVLLVGGAALFYDPFFGYGLNYAIESSYTAAQAIIKNNVEIYNRYSKEIQKEIRDRYKAREIWRKADNFFFNRFIDALNGKYDQKDKEIKKIINLFSELS